MADDSDRAAFRQRLEAGEWLTPGAVAAGLGIGRTTVHQLLEARKIAYRTKAGSRHRVCDPTHVLRLLDESETVHSADA